MRERLRFALDPGSGIVYNQSHKEAVMTKTVAEMLEEREVKARNGNWYPACGGSEQPFTTRGGRRLLYCWQPSTGKHAYLDLGTDLILTDEEAALAIGK